MNLYEELIDKVYLYKSDSGQDFANLPREFYERLKRHLKSEVSSGTLDAVPLPPQIGQDTTGK